MRRRRNAGRSADLAESFEVSAASFSVSFLLFVKGQGRSKKGRNSMTTSTATISYSKETSK